MNSCTSSNSWALSSISTGEAIYDSTRLRYISSKSHPPLTFEIMKFFDRIDTFISLNQFRFSSNPIEVTLTIGGEKFNELVPVYEGEMRIRLSDESTKRVIEALQEGVEIDILVDGFEEKLSGLQLKNYLKGFAE